MNKKEVLKDIQIITNRIKNLMKSSFDESEKIDTLNNTLENLINLYRSLIE